MNFGEFSTYLESAGAVGMILGAGLLALRLFLGNTGGQIDNTDLFQQARSQREAEEEAAAEERAKLRAAASGDTPGVFEEQMQSEIDGLDAESIKQIRASADIRRAFGSQPEPTRPVILPPANKRRITPED